MRKALKQIITKPQVLKALLAFFAAYIVLTIIWMQVSGIYGYGIAFIASEFVAAAKGARLGGIVREKDFVTATFCSLKETEYVCVDIRTKASAFSTNVPLVFSVLGALFPFIKNKKRACAEALLILILFHLLHVSLLETWRLTNDFTGQGIEAANKVRLSAYYFLWGVIEHASMSFAPFLIVTYIFVRFRK